MIQVSDSEDELDRSSSICPFGLVVVHVVSSSKEEEEEEEMPLEREKGLCELLAGRTKGSAPKKALGSQLLLTLPLPSVNPFAPANLKKRKKDKEVVEEEELVFHNEKFLQSFQGRPRIREGPPRSRAKRVGTWPRCALKIQCGTLN